jgi:hypothetical protein
MDRTLQAARTMLQALDAPAYDIGVLSHRGMLPGLTGLSPEQLISRLSLLKSHNARGAHIYVRPSGEHRYTVLDDLSADSVDRLGADGLEPCTVVETSPGNLQAWLKHDDVYPKQLSTFIAQTLAQRYQGDPSAADWRRFGRLAGFTNCKEKYRRPDGLFPFVLLQSATGQPCSRAAFLRLEMTQQFQLREQERERRIAQFLSDAGGRRSSHLSLERFRLSPRYAGRPASADIAFCVAAYSLAMPVVDIANALAADYLSRDPNPRRKAAYIERTLAKARAWAQR